MKTKRTFISIFTLCVALLLTACNGNGTSDTETSQNTQTESDTDSSDDSNTKLDDLYQQENQLFADHKDVNIYFYFYTLRSIITYSMQRKRNFRH